ncbi:diaminopimelate decarboxylase family protein [Thermoproteota archaeon]
MVKKTLPFTKKQIESIIQDYPTPFYIYDEKGIRNTVKNLISAFSWAPQFKEYFAVKALPNPYILNILKEEGCGADCSSLPELILAEKTGIINEAIMFTSNDTPADEFQKARELGAIINLDDITHISFLESHGNLPDLLSFRYNPGPLRGGNAIIGHPEEAKYGFTKAQLFEGYKQIRDKGVKRFGLHTMLASNELDPQYFIDTAAMLFELVLELKKELGIRIEFVNLGGGIGIPYKPSEQAVDLNKVSLGIQTEYDRLIKHSECAPLKIFWELGRMITGPHGYLVSRVRHEKHTYKDYIGLDSCMANLMRPGLYNAYHHITVLGKETQPHTHKYDVTGSLCENNDKFAIDRMLPSIEIGDIIVIHDTGAHGHAMGFNYNAKLRSAELLLKENNEVQLIRRAETVDDYFATLDFKGLKKSI